MFLYGKLQKIVYKQQSLGFHHRDYLNHVCRIKKSLSSLDQALWAWFNILCSFLVSYGFVNSKSDPSLFVFLKGDVKIYTLVYVDDILMIGNNNQVIHKCISTLATVFSIKHAEQEGPRLGVGLIQLLYLLNTVGVDMSIHSNLVVNSSLGSGLVT